MRNINKCVMLSCIIPVHAMMVHDGRDDHDGHDGQGMLQCASTGAIVVDIDAWHGYRSVRVSNKQPS